MDEPGDRRLQRIIVLFTFFFLVIASFWIQKPIRTSRFLTSFGPTMLPWVKLGTAALTLPVVLCYSALSARYRRQPLVLLCTTVFTGGSLVFWYLFSTRAPQWVNYAYFFYVDIFNSVLVGLFWGFANDLSTPQQARRDYGFIGAGGIVGGIFGSALTGWTIKDVGGPNLLLVCAGLTICIAAVSFLVPSPSTSTSPSASSAKPEPTWRDGVAGARMTLASRYLTLIALLVVLYEIVSNLVDYQFNTFVSRRYADEASMASFIGRFSSASIVAAALAQLLLTTWVLRRWGPAVGVLLLPIALGLGSGGFLIAPLFAVIAATFFADATLSYSLNQAAKEVLYTPTDEATKYQAKAFIDMFLMRFAKGLGSLLILGSTWLLSERIEVLSAVSLAMIGLWVLAARAAGRRFEEQTAEGSPQTRRPIRRLEPGVPIAVVDGSVPAKA